MIYSMFSIVLKLIQIWRFHFVGLGVMLKYRISQIWYSPVVLLKIKFLAIKKPHPPRYWGVGLKVDLVFLALSNTANGKPAVVAQSNTRSVLLSTKVENSLVVASHVSNDPAVHPVLMAQTPLTPLFGAPVGSAAGGSGYMHVESSSTVKLIFSGRGQHPTTLGVAFAPRH